MTGRKTLLGAACALCVAAPTAQAGTATLTYNASSTFRVPAGVTHLTVTAFGGTGGSTTVSDQNATKTVLGGRGAKVTGGIDVAPSTLLSLDVGTGGGLPGQFMAATGNGGGLSGIRNETGYLLVAAGGGGAGGAQLPGYASTDYLPGVGGSAGAAPAAGADGASSGFAIGGGGGAGTASAGGAAGSARATVPTAGTKGQGGAGGGADAPPVEPYKYGVAAGGGGGAGYFGGGGGAGAVTFNGTQVTPYGNGGGGGAGSSYVGGTGVSGGVVSQADRGTVPSITLTFTDNTPPAVQLAATPANTKTISGKAGTDGGDAGTVTVEFYSGTTVSGTPPVTASAPVDPATGAFSVPTPALADGTWTARVLQTDAGGNTGISLVQTFTVDATPPTISFAGLRPSYSLGEVAAAGITCADAGSGVTGCTAPVLVDTAAAGPHTVSVTATDGAGNVTTQSASYSVVVPAAAPGPAPVAPAPPKADAKFKITKTTVTRSGSSLQIKLSGSVVKGATGTVAIGKSSVKIGKKGTWSLSTKVKGGAKGVKITVNYSGDATYAALAVTKTAKPSAAKKSAK